MYTPVLPPDYHMGMDFLYCRSLWWLLVVWDPSWSRIGWIPAWHPAVLRFYERGQANHSRT